MSGPNLGIKIGVEGTAQAENALRGMASSVQQLGTAAEKTRAEMQQAKQTYETWNTNNTTFANLNKQLQQVGVSAAQTANAMRMLPMQMTDIGVGLASGQNPFTVLLQQGGQLKDQFGGIGAALRATGTYVAGLATPFNLAAAGVAGVGLAFYKAEQEAKEFQKTLLLTGNAVGASVGQLQSMAEGLAAGFGMTNGKAAEAVNALAGTGRVAAAQLKDFSSTALEAERAFGLSVESIAKNFAELGKDPVGASNRLNESMGYLTAATYQQIKAAKEQGDETKAAALAQDAYGAALKGRTAEMEQNLGIMERGWRLVSGVAKEAWDNMLAIDRPIGLEKQMAKLATDINKGYTLPWENLDEMLAKYRELGRLRDEQNAKAFKAAQDRKAQGDAIAAIDAVTKVNTQALSKQEQMNKALSDYDKALEKIRAQDPNSALLNAAQIERSKNAIREQYKETDKAATVYEQLTKRVGDFATMQEAVGDGQQKLTDGQKLAIKIAEDMAAATGKISEAEKTRVMTAVQGMLVLEQQMALEREAIALINESAKENYKAIDALDKKNASLDEDIKRQREAIAAMGLSKQALGELEAARLNDAAAAADRNAIMARENLLNDSLAAQYEEQAKKLRELAKLKTEAGQKDQAIEQAKAASDAWKRYAEDINRTLTDSLMRGFEAGKGFAQNLKDAVVNMFKTMVLRPVVQFVVGGVTGALGIPGSAMAGVSPGQAANFMNVGSTLSSVYSSITGSFAALGDKVAFAAQDIGAWLVNNTTGVLNQAGSSIMASAGSLGTLASYAGGALAGVGVGKLISGQYTTGLGKNTLEVGGTALGAILGGPLGAAIGGAVGGVINRALGMGPGEIRGEGLTGTFSTDGANVQSYQQWFQKGGWLRRNKSGTNYSAVSSELDDFLDGALRMTGAATQEYAKLIGLNADAISGFSKQINISLRGLDAAGQEKAIADAIGSFGEDLAKAVMGDAGMALAKRGESASAALTRLASALGGVNDVLKSLGQTLLAGSLSGAGNAQSLLDLFGGQDAYTSAASQYLQSYYTEAERTALASRNLTDALARVGVAMPSTIEQYRKLVEAQDLNTEAGRQAYATLLNLAPAFAEVTKAERDRIDAIKASSQTIYDEIKRLRGLDTQGGGLALLQTQFATLTGQARAGDATALSKLPEISQAIEQASKISASSAIDMARVRAWLAGSLSDTLKALGLDVPKFAAGGLHAGGIRLVGENGPELEVTGPARYLSAADTAAALSGGGSSLVQEVRALRAELEGLRAEARATAVNTGKSARLMDRVTQGTDTLIVSQVTA